ncbi:LysR substrate-binding domain-containing protein [Mesorhizobium delmotii]|uniref:Putative LysR-family transcriptional regulator n=1 Tax=Mesorhizobium delmotii TaxID=1631247 RepID=A0A2P9ARH7_9HYPH|nr:LysR substrate-binding domain-containing protein [Mesorhizobium delmotii]SJM33756.1 putative LysR-family transcriptional regulator [Mesorhizobium delmotii]
MNLRDVEVFHAIMISGGASSAAELMGMSQPSVSRSLAKLERSVGFSLFQRVKGRLAVTREGRLFHEEVVRNFVGLDALRQAALRIREVGEGTVRVASLAALGTGLVPRAVAQFLQQHPNVHVSLQVRTSSIVRDLVLSGQVDIGLAADEIDTSGLHSSVFATPRAMCVVPKHHRLASRAVVRLSDLHHERFVALSPEDTVRQTLDRMLAANNIEPHIVVDTPFSATVITLVAEGAGIGIANPFSIDPARRSQLAIVPFEPQLNFRALILRPPGDAASRLVSAFVGMLYDARNAFRPLTSGEAT